MIAAHDSVTRFSESADEKDEIKLSHIPIEFLEFL